MINTVAAWLLSLSVVGYSVIGVIASVTPLELAIPFRLIVVGLAVWLVAASVARPVPWRSFLWLFLFWAIYLSRLVWDFMAGVSGADEALMFFVATGLAPGLALCMARMDWVTVAERIVIIGGLCVALALAAALIGWDVGLDEERTAGRLAFSRLNPITVGHTAVTTLIAIMCLMTLKGPRFKGFLYLIVAGLAIASLVMAASRGPVVALALCAVVFAVSTGRWYWLLLLGLAAIWTALVGESTILQRLLALTLDRVDDTSALARLDVMANAIGQFEEHPILGNAYIEPEYQIYPHNLFIEALMATGVVGTFVLVVLLWKAMQNSLRLMRGEVYLFPLLLLQYFIASQLSYAIWSISQLWVLLPVVLSRYTAIGEIRAATDKRRITLPRPPKASLVR
jgi:O-antigen ligase